MSPRSSACSRGRYVLDDEVDIHGLTEGKAEAGWSAPGSTLLEERYSRKNCTSSVGFINFE